MALGFEGTGLSWSVLVCPGPSWSVLVFPALSWSCPGRPRSFDLSESSELHFGPSSPSLAHVLAPPPTISAHLGAGTTDFRRFSEGASTIVTIQSYRHTYKHWCCSSVAWDGAKDGGRGIGGREIDGARGRGDSGAMKTSTASNVSLS